MWKTNIFVKTCLYNAVRSLLVVPSLLPHILSGRSQVSLFLASVASLGDISLFLASVASLGDISFY